MAAKRRWLTLCALAAISACKKKDGAPACPDLVVVQAPFPGASPREVEELVVIPIEEQVKPHAKAIESISRENEAIVFVQVDDGDKGLDAIEAAVGKLESLPADAQPLVSRVPSGSLAQLIVLNGDVTQSTLREVAERTRDDLLAEPGIPRVQALSSGRRQVVAEIAPEKLAAVGLTLDQIAAAIRADQIEVPGGRVVGANQPLIRAADRRGDDFFRELERMPLGGSQPLRLGDIASIKVEATTDPVFYGGKHAVAMLVILGDRKSALPTGDEMEVEALPSDLRRTVSPVFELRRCGASAWESKGLTVIEARVGEQGTALVNRWFGSDAKVRPVILGRHSLLLGETPAFDRTELVLFGEDQAPGVLDVLRQRPGVASSLLLPEGHRLRFSLSSDDLDQLEKTALRFEARVRGLAQVIGLSRQPDTAGRPDYQLRVKDTRVVSERDVARAVRQALYGVEALRWQEGRNEAVLTLRTHSGEPDFHSILQQPYPLPSGETRPLADLVEVSIRGPVAPILRKNHRRIVLFNAIAPTKSDLARIKAFIEKELRPSLAPAVTLTYQ